jgi:hypothetical protein
MDAFPYDGASKWLIEHHGDALLRLAGVTDITSWRPLQAEIVHPRRLPDGLLEVYRVGQDGPDIFVLEISTYPDRRVPEQLLSDAALVYLDRGMLPEILAVVLHPKGNVRVPDRIDLRSPNGWTNWQASWRVVEMRTLPAADLLATRDLGLAPWAILARWDGPPEELFQQERSLVDEQAPPDERSFLLTVMQMLATLRYTDQRLFDILGGEKVVIESGYFGGIIAKQVAEQVAERVAEQVAERVAEQVALSMHTTILNLLTDRLGSVPPDVEAAVHAVRNQQRLDRANRFAARAADYESFRRDLNALLAGNGA